MESSGRRLRSGSSRGTSKQNRGSEGSSAHPLEAQKNSNRGGGADSQLKRARRRRRSTSSSKSVDSGQEGGEIRACGNSCDLPSDGVTNGMDSSSDLGGNGVDGNDATGNDTEVGGQVLRQMKRRRRAAKNGEQDATASAVLNKVQLPNSSKPDTGTGTTSKVESNDQDEDWLLQESIRCQVCNRSFDDATAASVCIAFIHKQLRCHLCLKTFPYQSDALLKHLQRRHQSQVGLEDLLPCPVCDKATPYKSISTHLLTTHFLSTLALRWTTYK